MAVEQVGVGREELEHFGEAARGEVVVAADARALLKMDGRGEAVRDEHLVQIPRGPREIRIIGVQNRRPSG